MAHPDQIDVMISFDTTGSMYPCLTQVRRSVVEMARELFEIPNIRIGIKGQGDYCDGPLATTTLDLTNEKNAVIDFIQHVPPTGGGDAPECYELVLHEARAASWRSGKSKVLVLIGDDVPHGANERQNTMHLDWRNELKLLLEMGVTVYAVQALGRRHATPFWNEVARTTGGFHLELDQFSNVTEMIKAICYKQVSQDRLGQYEEELSKAGKMNRSVDSFIRVLMGRKSSARFTSPKGLDAVPAGRFQVLTVDRDTAIKEFAEENGCTFKKGRGFYEFAVPVEVQPYKEVILMNNRTGDMFSGDKAREMAGIPIGGATVKVRPGVGTLGDYTCFIQSTSSNRKLLAGTRFLYEVDDWS